jgi:beta-lactamase superfamily II metal-dependent hydrolase
MRFTVLDVGHGFCAYLIADNGNLILFDCGHKTDPILRPSDHLFALGQRSVERLFISNYDEDHISDLPNVKKKLGIRIFHRNRTISSSQLRRLKEETGPITEAMDVLLDMMDVYTHDVTDPPSFPEVIWNCFWNRYSIDFDDTNNISLVTFLDFKGIRIVIPGDLETTGWQNLLRSPSFREKLSGVDIFIASHHGRENGYCEDLFKFCTPDVIVVPDGPKQYASQEMINTYAQHAGGITFNNEKRYVLTTRNEGTFWWDI